jgi:hypothetical protein
MKWKCDRAREFLKQKAVLIGNPSCEFMINMADQMGWNPYDPALAKAAEVAAAGAAAPGQQPRTGTDGRVTPGGATQAPVEPIRTPPSLTAPGQKPDLKTGEYPPVGPVSDDNFLNYLGDALGSGPAPLFSGPSLNAAMAAAQAAITAGKGQAAATDAAIKAGYAASNTGSGTGGAGASGPPLGPLNPWVAPLVAAGKWATGAPKGPWGPLAAGAVYVGDMLDRGPQAASDSLLKGEHGLPLKAAGVVAAWAAEVSLDGDFNPERFGTAVAPETYNLLFVEVKDSPIRPPPSAQWRFFWDRGTASSSPAPSSMKVGGNPSSAGSATHQTGGAVAWGEAAKPKTPSKEAPASPSGGGKK